MPAVAEAKELLTLAAEFVGRANRVLWSAWKLNPSDQLEAAMEATRDAMRDIQEAINASGS